MPSFTSISTICILFLSAVVFEALTLFVPAVDPSIRYTGRTFVQTRNKQTPLVLFDWSGVSIELGLNMSLVHKIEQINAAFYIETLPNTSGNEYDVILNGNVTNPVGVLNFSSPSYAPNCVATKTENNCYYPILLKESMKGMEGEGGVTTLMLRKRTEALFGPDAFYGFQIIMSSSEPTNLLVPPPHRKRHIEFIGDSITCGYGILGTDPCNFSAGTEDNDLTYGRLTADRFSASLYLEAWSGMGMVRNYGSPNTTSPIPFPSFYKLILASQNMTNPANQWDFSQWTPDVVVINLGTNDYSTPPQPPQSIFVNGYMTFVNALFANYGLKNKNLQVFVVCGPVISGTCCEYVQEVAQLQQKQGNKVTYIDLQNILSATDYGCNGHPNVDGHWKMYNLTAPVIGKAMGWD